MAEKGSQAEYEKLINRRNEIWDKDQATLEEEKELKRLHSDIDKLKNAEDEAEDSEAKKSKGEQAMGAAGGAAKAVGGAAVSAGKGLMGGLGNIKDLVEPNSATIFLILSAALFLLDVSIGYKGFNITRIESVPEILKFIASLGYMIGIWIFFFIFVSKERDFKSLVSSIIAFVVVIFGLTLAFKFDPLAILHILFILIFWMGFLRKSETSATANWMLITLLVADMFLFSILNYFSPDVALILQGFPFLFFLTVFFVYEKTSNLIALGFIFFIFGWYFLTAAPALAEHFGLAGIEGIRTYLPNPKELGGLFKENVIDKGFGKIKTGVAAWLSGQIQYAITGKVEQNQFEPLGVYLDNVESVATKYYIDKNADDFEEVIIYGTVRGRTLDDPINVKVGCFVEDRDKKIFAKEPSGKTDPDKKFTIFSLEEQDFACTFKGCDSEDNPQCPLKVGSNTITTFADFNFETLAFQKVYFIDRGRLRAMTREGLDVFEEFDIRDRNPVPVYTNGPAAIEMGTSSPLVGVSNNYLAFPRFSLAIKNRPGWQGRITKLKELVLLMPKGVRIENPGFEFKKIVDDLQGIGIVEELVLVETEETDCNVRFRPYELADCQASCNKFVYNECNTVCDGSYGSGYSSEKESCQAYCGDSQQDCEDQCLFLFNEDNQEYTGYALAESTLKTFNSRIQDEGATERFERFNCKLNPIRDEVLGNAPITTKFFRVKVRYDYRVESSLTVQIVDLTSDDVRKVPVESGEGTEAEPSSSDTATPASSALGVPTATPTAVPHRTPSGMVVTPISDQGIVAEITGGPLGEFNVGYREEIKETVIGTKRGLEFHVRVTDLKILVDEEASPSWIEDVEESSLNSYKGAVLELLKNSEDYENLLKLIAVEWAIDDLYTYKFSTSVPVTESPSPSVPIPITLVNPGFESELQGKDVDWKGIIDLVRDDTKQFNGKYSLKLGGATSKCYPLEEGTYRLSAFTLLEEERAQATLGILDFLDTECKKQDFTTSNKFAIAINNGKDNEINKWHETAGTFSLKRSGSIIIQLGANFGFGWYDNVKLEKLEISVPVPTATPSPADKFDLGDICGVDILDCNNLDNNFKCKSGNCRWISNGDICGCVNPLVEST